MEYNPVKTSEKKLKDKEKLEKMAKNCLEKKDALIKANTLVDVKLFELEQAKEKEKKSVITAEEKDR
jgi:hypothetical protein